MVKQRAGNVLHVFRCEGNLPEQLAGGSGDANNVILRFRDHLFGPAEFSHDGGSIGRAIALPLPLDLARAGIKSGQCAFVVSSHVRDQQTTIDNW